MPAINFEERLIRAGVAIEPVVAFDKATGVLLLLDFTDGVYKWSEREKYLPDCPDPDYLLKMMAYAKTADEMHRQ